MAPSVTTQQSRRRSSDCLFRRKGGIAPAERFLGPAPGRRTVTLPMGRWGPAPRLTLLCSQRWAGDFGRMGRAGIAAGTWPPLSGCGSAAMAAATRTVAVFHCGAVTGSIAGVACLAWRGRLPWRSRPRSVDSCLTEAAPSSADVRRMVEELATRPATVDCRSGAATLDGPGLLVEAVLEGSDPGSARGADLARRRRRAWATCSARDLFDIAAVRDGPAPRAFRQLRRVRVRDGGANGR